MSFFSQSERPGETEAKSEEDDAVSSRIDFGVHDAPITKDWDELESLVPEKNNGSGA
ncbi:hypothetical protein CDL12_19433 [Handroanthus impetiginosus]|uniref:Uncharacterized protein n=1 Tax=Handroanthus impetiginosus TaxID=429701 RepID=A0A2G9GSK9_9LAMI|nr:hypothetical protein CDL12_19433 [Handroanthus impetiginosus]